MSAENKDFEELIMNLKMEREKSKLMLHIKKKKVILINMLSEHIVESEEVEVIDQEQIKQTNLVDR